MKLTLTTVVLFCLGLALPAGDAFGQTAKDFAGFWTIVSADKVNQDGSEGEPAFGPNPKGFLVFVGYRRGEQSCGAGNGRPFWQILSQPGGPDRYFLH